MMKAQLIDGKKLYLRKLLKKDLTRKYLEWLNDREVVEFLESGRAPVSMKDLKEFYNKVAESENDIIFAIVDKNSNRHIGNVKIGNINRIHRYADLGILIGEKSLWGKGYGTEAIDLVLGYAFTQLDLNKVFLGVYADNISAIELYKKAGFSKEGAIRKLLFRNGKYYDKVIMGILSSEYSGNKN